MRGEDKLFSEKADGPAAFRGFEDRLEHRDAMLLVATGDREWAPRLSGAREMLQLGALGADLREREHLRLHVGPQVLWIHDAGLHLPRREVLDVADLVAGRPPAIDLTPFRVNRF